MKVMMVVLVMLMMMAMMVMLTMATMLVFMIIILAPDHSWVSYGGARERQAHLKLVTLFCEIAGGCTQTGRVGFLRRGWREACTLETGRVFL